MAGGPGTGSQNGVGADATFGSVAGLASDGTNLWIADAANYVIRGIIQRRLPTGSSSTLPTAPASRGYPTSLRPGPASVRESESAGSLSKARGPLSRGSFDQVGRKVSRVTPRGALFGVATMELWSRAPLRHRWVRDKIQPSGQFR